MIQQLAQGEPAQGVISGVTERRRRAALGQFMTPLPIARFMASMFPAGGPTPAKLLDAGAGLGALSCAFLDRWKRKEFTFGSVDVVAYELDPGLRTQLADHLAAYRRASARLVVGDFIELATELPGDPGGYTHAILNPPYKKINSESRHRAALRRVGIETVNLYTAFVALALDLMAPGGQLVAIIPRSFCNGPYYRPFREFILRRAAIRRIHLFHSRDTAFSDDAVLQENVIIRLERGGKQGRVTISTSSDDTLVDLTSRECPFARIVRPDDPQRFIHIPTSGRRSKLDLDPALGYSLGDLRLSVSTGPIVDFRLRAHLRHEPGRGTVPLLYPAHFAGGRVTWPKPDGKKPSAIVRNAETERWLYPCGFYCVVRRFSSKEERRRVVASVVDPAEFGGACVLGFENHLNVFHAGRRGIPEELARGLAAYLNTPDVDQAFRQFNGHTQVNATDLKQMTYPNRGVLAALGRWAMRHAGYTEAMVARQLASLTK